jgi:signal transduction histidine kinase
MSGLRFLLLEDSLVDTELIAAILTEGGITCNLVQVKTEAEFQTALEQGNFDLILSDYSLPGFDGIAALKMAQSFCPDVPFIFVTATMGEEVAIETLKSGATDYVLKQRLERIVPSVLRSLREAQERRARQQAEAELRQQKEELERANRIKDEFLAVLSHELRSPLNAILGWSKILRTRQLDRPTLMRGLETIERNAKLQTQLIEDLLDVSGIIRGKLSLHPQKTNLIPTIEAAIDTMRLAAQAKSIDLQFTIMGNGETKPKIPIPKFFVLGDSSRLQQIVWNLLSNAIKFTPQGGRVEVLLENCSNYAQITVKDTGIGINSDFLPYVFDSFRQADGSITRKHSGLGLGLAIVRHLVELHGGTVSAESLGDGQGSTFMVKLPLFERS